MKGIVYILKDKGGRLYVGSTSNLQRRLSQHTIGHTRTTRMMDGPKVVFHQEFNNLLTARRVERRLKRFHRRDFLLKIIEDGIIRGNMGA